MADEGDDYEQFDVGIVVFVRAWGVDNDDAADRAQATIARNLYAALNNERAIVDDGPRATDRPIALLSVRELRHATSAGFIRVDVTGRAAYNRGLPPL